MGGPRLRPARKTRALPMCGHRVGRPSGWADGLLGDLGLHTGGSASDLRADRRAHEKHHWGRALGGTGGAELRGSETWHQIK